jgi:hypothetical protein
VGAAGHAQDGGGRVLIVTLANLVEQTLEMARQFYPGESLPIVRIKSKVHLRAWCAGRELNDQGDVAGRSGDVAERPSDAGRGAAEGEHAVDERVLDEEQGGRRDELPAAPDQQDHAARPARTLIAIVNYEKFNPDDVGKAGAIDECRHLAGVVLDESSRLKPGGGKQKWCIIHSCQGGRLQAEPDGHARPQRHHGVRVAGVVPRAMRSDNEIIWTYFTRDEKTHRWTVRKHAREPRSSSSCRAWSIYVRDPRRYGWRMGVKRCRPSPTTSTTRCSDDGRAAGVRARRQR